MAGHSKWNNIKQRKGAQDSKRAKIFQKISREIYMAAKLGGSGDPETNAQLRLILDKARANNVPNDNIQRAIKKATDPASTENYKEASYEGYGPDGSGIIVHVLTDNFNRTATNVRVAFTKNGGNLGETGSVSYMFDRKGYIAIERKNLDLSEDDMLMEVLEAGGEDLETSDDVFEIYTAPTDFAAVRDALSESFDLATAELTMVPNNYVQLQSENVANFEKMIEILEDDDDVTEVYHNVDLGL